MIKLSVIIPVYNTAIYLKKCLDSIFNQGFKDFEAICVDDGSTDNSVEILGQYNVKIMRQKNQGSGVARNEALKAAKGEYILFIDSDDWLINGAFEKLMQKQGETGADVLIFGGLIETSKKIRRGSYSVNKIPKKYFNKIFNKDDFKNDIFKFPLTAWTKLYKRKFLIENDIGFQNIRVGQDQIFFIKSMLSASSIAILDENLYVYKKKRKGSVTSCKKKWDFSPIEVFYEVEKAVFDWKYKQRIIDRYFSKAVTWLPKMRDELKPGYFNELSKLLSYVQEKYPNEWWRNFNPKVNSRYIELKLMQIIYRICNLKK